jgi:F1F0 ATPase subunit 2
MDAQAMTKLFLTEFELTWDIVGVGAWLAVGALVGAFQFLTLRWNVRMLAVDRPLPLALAAQFVRLALVAGALAVIAGYFGALPLLLATAGILAARTAILRFGEQP